jgi:hypothetical protein
MIRCNLSRAAALLVLCALLASPLAAAPKFRSESSTPAAAEDLFGWLRSGLSLIWSKAGCQVDPFGRCEIAKNGCQVDPFGRCLLDKATSTPVTTKNGCQLDPNGRCIG